MTSCMYIVVSVDNVTMYQVLCQYKPLLFKHREDVFVCLGTSDVPSYPPAKPLSG